MQNVVVVSHTVRTHVTSPKIWRSWDPAPLRWGVADPLRNMLFPTCVTTPNLVILGQTVGAWWWRSARKFDSSLFSRSTQSHWNRHGPIGYLWLHINVP